MTCFFPKQAKLRKIPSKHYLTKTRFNCPWSVRIDFLEKFRQVNGSKLEHRDDKNRADL